MGFFSKLFKNNKEKEILSYRIIAKYKNSKLEKEISKHEYEDHVLRWVNIGNTRSKLAIKENVEIKDIGFEIIPIYVE